MLQILATSDKHHFLDVFAFVRGTRVEGTPFGSLAEFKRQSQDSTHRFNNNLDLKWPTEQC